MATALKELVRLGGSCGFLVGISLFGLIWLIIWLMSMPKGNMSKLEKLKSNHSFEFEPLGEKGAFEKLISIYFDIAKTLVGLASGSIVLLVGSAAFHTARHLPESFASPLFLLGLCILYAIFFMVLTTINYEAYRHKTAPYSRFKYSRNQALAYSALLCFCVGYIWLILIVTE